MVSILEWVLTGIGAVVVGVVLGAMLLLGAIVAKIEEEKRGPDGNANPARRRRVPRVRRLSEDISSAYFRRR